MKPFKADLHCHSTCSDGSKTPEEIVLIAKEIGLSALAITDHDSIDSYALAKKTAVDEGIELITGVEFSTVHNKASIHILAYAFSPTSEIIESFCKMHHLRRSIRNQAILENLKKHNLPISEEDLLQELTTGGKTTVGRPHIAKAMIRKGYVKSIQEAFQKYLGDGKCCYAEGPYFSTEETIDLIHEAKGLAIIAHPHLVEPSGVLLQLLEMDFDGIECYYARFNMDKHKRWLKIAEKKNWMITGGSDFHGDIKPNLPLGCSFVDEALFKTLHDHFKTNL